MMLSKHRVSGKKATTATIAVWYTVGNLFAKGLAAISTPVFTRLMSGAEYGMFSNFSTWESVLFIIVSLDFATSIMRAKYDFDDIMDRYMSTIVLFSNTFTLFLYLIVEVNSAFFVQFLNMELQYIRILFLQLLFSPVFSFIQLKHRVYGKYKLFVLLSVLSALCRTLTSIVLVLNMQDKLLGRVYGYVIPYVILNLVLWIRVMYKGRGVSLKCLKYACALSIPLIPHNLSGILLGEVDCLMITEYCGAEKTALYSLGYQISLIASILWTSMNQAWGPWLFDNMHENNRASIWKNSKVYLGSFFVMIIGLLLISPELVWILGGKAYSETIYVMPPIILGCSMQFIYGMYVNIEFYEKKTGLVSIGTIGAAIINILLNLMFIPQLGYEAAAYTTFIGYAALLLFHYIAVQFYCKNYSNIYDKKFIIIIICTLLFTAAMMLLLYRMTVIRYLLIVMYTASLAIFGYRYKEEILSLFGRKRKAKER